MVDLDRVEALLRDSSRTAYNEIVEKHVPAMVEEIRKLRGPTAANLRSTIAIGMEEESRPVPREGRGAKK